MTHVSRRHAAAATEREAWYGTAYTAAPLRAELLDRWAAAPPHAALQLPPPNPFIPTDFALAADLEPGAATTPAARPRAASAPAARTADANGAADAQDPLAPLSASAAAAARAAAAAWAAPLRKLRGLGGENVRHTDAGSTGALEMAFACTCHAHAHVMHTPCTRHARAGTLDAFEFVTFGAPEALCSKGVSYYEVTLLAAAKKGTNDVQAGFATADFRVLGDAAGHSPDGAHPAFCAATALCTGRLQPHAPCRLQPCALGSYNPTTPCRLQPHVPRRRRRRRVVGYRRRAEAQVVQGAGTP